MKVLNFLYGNSYHFLSFYDYYYYFLTAHLFLIGRQSYRVIFQHFKAKFDQHYFPYCDCDCER